MILDGNLVSSKIREDIKNEVKTFLIKPCLAVIQIGENEASSIYIKAKEKVCIEIGIYFKHIKFESDVTNIAVINKIMELNNDNHVHGILLQLPIPNKLDVNKLINTIKPSKDVDGLTDINVGRLTKNIDGFIPCTPMGIMELFKEYNIDLEGKHIVVIGKSNLVGKPLANLLLNNKATVTVCHSKTTNLSKHTKEADIIVSATGIKGLVTKDMVKKDSIVIDVGISRVDNKIYGDIGFDEVKTKASMITPVPGGVGPMTVVMLLKNVIKSYKRMNKIK